MTHHHRNFTNCQTWRAANTATAIALLATCWHSKKRHSPTSFFPAFAPSTTTTKRYSITAAYRSTMTLRLRPATRTPWKYCSGSKTCALTAFCWRRYRRPHLAIKFCCGLTTWTKTDTTQRRARRSNTWRNCYRSTRNISITCPRRNPATFPLNEHQDRRFLILTLAHYLLFCPIQQTIQQTIRPATRANDRRLFTAAIPSAQRRSI